MSPYLRHQHYTAPAWSFGALSHAADVVVWARRARAVARYAAECGGPAEAADYEAAGVAYGEALTVMADRRAAYSAAHGIDPERMDANGFFTVSAARNSGHCPPARRGNPEERNTG